MFPGASYEILEVLDKLLQFNPNLRSSDCIKNTIFDKIRVKKLESINCKPIYLEVDIENASDYDFQKDLKTENIEICRKLILKEVSYYINKK